MKHFAGDVTYCVDGFLDKNMDPLNEDVEKARPAQENAPCLCWLPLLNPKDQSLVTLSLRQEQLRAS